MMQDKSKWVEEVLESTQGMASASPRADLYGQLKAKLGKEKPRVRLISLGAVSAAAACLLVLFTLNIKAVSRYNTAETVEVRGEDASVTDIVDYYELGSNNTGL
jgi:hypothetical protein